MKLSRTAAYAIHAMIHVARHNDGPPIIGRAAADELGIPVGFLLRIMVALSRARLLRSLKGPNGGYNLGRPAKSITLLDVMEAAEGPMVAYVDPMSSPPGALDKHLLEVVTATTNTVRKELSRVTVADLVGKAKKVR
jgi:Rrf2 family protein